MPWLTKIDCRRNSRSMRCYPRIDRLLCVPGGLYSGLLLRGTTVFMHIIVVCVIMGMPVNCKKPKVHRIASGCLTFTKTERKINPRAPLGNLNWVYGHTPKIFLSAWGLVLTVNLSLQKNWGRFSWNFTWPEPFRLKTFAWQTKKNLRGMPTDPIDAPPPRMGVNLAPTFHKSETTMAMAHPDEPFSGMNDDDGSGRRLCSSEVYSRRQRARTQPPTPVWLESVSCGGVPTYPDGWWVVHVVPQRADGSAAFCGRSTKISPCCWAIFLWTTSCHLDRFLYFLCENPFSQLQNLRRNENVKCGWFLSFATLTNFN